jgi:hypothetical protein
LPSQGALLLPLLLLLLLLLLLYRLTRLATRSVPSEWLS